MDLDLNMTAYPWESKTLYTLRLIEQWFLPFLWLFAIYFAFSLSRTFLVHKNLRILLSLCAPSILVSTTSHNIFIYVIKWAENRQQHWTTEFVYCTVAFTHLTSSAFAGLILFGVVLERLRASVKNQNYESSGIKFGIILCAQSLVSSVLLSLYVIVYDMWTIDQTNPFYKYRYSFELHPSLGVICYGSAAVSTSLSVLLMCRLYKRNKMLRLRTRGCVPLALRYQYNENVHSLRTLIPLICMYGACTVVGSVLVILREIRFNLTGPTDIQQMIYLQLVYLSMDMFVFVGVPFMFVSYSPLKHLLFSDIQRLVGQETSQVRVVTNERFYQKHAPPINETTDIYFEHLRHSWR
ncbi:hypothetical protein M3Y97_00282700 [Aphelenchoides bicaudatus]|nr:hypothetical protein M3Y97_00282700 [Aphelenchoides bicaudatus]